MMFFASHHHLHRVDQAGKVLGRQLVITGDDRLVHHRREQVHLLLLMLLLMWLPMATARIQK